MVSITIPLPDTMRQPQLYLGHEPSIFLRRSFHKKPTGKHTILNTTKYSVRNANPQEFEELGNLMVAVYSQIRKSMK
jgi:hypothetical protein